MTQRAAIIGGGVIGGGWAARFLLNGWDVAVFDPDPAAARKIGEVLANARRSLPALYDRVLPPEGTLSFHDDPATAVGDADWVQESVPERLDLKHRVYDTLRAACRADAVIGSSTSGFKPSELDPEHGRIIVAHPFNPVYLLPLVELVGDEPTCDRAAGMLRRIGMFPLVLRKEIDAHVADRLLESVWRESLWLVRDGIATTAEIDEAIRMGFGLRWAQMGLFETYRIAGGEAGMKHFMGQFGPALSWPWSRLTDVPDFDDALVDLIAGQSDAQSGHLPLRELERLRDDNLVGIMRALRRTGSGAGSVIAAHEAALALPGNGARPLTLDRQVPVAWGDGSGKVKPAHYVEAAMQATDRILDLVGAGPAYVARGRGYETAECDLRLTGETRAGDRLRATSRIAGAEGGALDLAHVLERGDGTAVATVEVRLVHRDTASGRVCPPSADIAGRIARFAARHADPEHPTGQG